MKILIADDNDEVRNVLADVLNMVGYDVLTAATGRQALERLSRDGPVDAIITDLAMPGMTGGDLLNELKRLNMTTPVIVLTGMADLPPTIPPVVAAFRKPAPPEELLAKLDGLKSREDKAAEAAVEELGEEESESDSPFPPLKK